MGVSANIKLRSRPVITIISDMFTKQLDGVSASANLSFFEVLNILLLVSDVFGSFSASAIGGIITFALIFL